MLKSVAVMVLPGVSPFEFGVVCEVFGLDRSSQIPGLPAFDFRICAPEPGLVPTNSGFPVLVERDLSAAQDADLVVMLPYHSFETLPESVMDALRSADCRGAKILSVCSGAFALAKTGLLDGRRATTHWQFSERLATEYPQVSVDENVLYVEDGNIVTSAGTAAGIDASLHILRAEFGAKVASAVARGMVVPPHRDGGQAQFIDRPVPESRGDSMQEILVWMADNLDQDLPVSLLAAKVHMSERTFARRFRTATGATPAAWVNAQRLLKARILLEETQLSIENVARISGFGQAVLLRHHFQKTLGTSPAAYRRTFGDWHERAATA